MKEKILSAISEGLMNALSADIEDQDIDFSHGDISSEYIPYETRTVDMGKAGIWCEYNIGAYPGNRPEDWYGNYYTWGGTGTNDDYSWKTYKHCKGTKDTLTKYNNSDRLECLVPKDDIVTMTLGNKFRMPTLKDYEKLVNDTANKWVMNYKGVYGLNGRLFTAENGNTLFFPTAGYYGGSNLNEVCSSGNVWTSTLLSDDPECAYGFFVYSEYVSTDYTYRYLGLSVRGIQNSSMY